jgi:hypothetical protein
MLRYTVCFVWVWNLDSRAEGGKLAESENKVLRETFGAKRDEVTREWIRLHNEELYDLYCSPNINIWLIT